MKSQFNSEFHYSELRSEAKNHLIVSSTFFFLFPVQRGKKSHLFNCLSRVMTCRDGLKRHQTSKHKEDDTSSSLIRKSHFQLLQRTAWVSAVYLVCQTLQSVLPSKQPGKPPRQAFYNSMQNMHLLIILKNPGGKMRLIIVGLTRSGTPK